jgi:hypothetical protein
MALLSKAQQIQEHIMKTIVTSALLALSILGGIATVASAANGEAFGARTTPQQQPSPN